VKGGLEPLKVFSCRHKQTVKECGPVRPSAMQSFI
jgi:hypothetical protein